MLQRVRGNGQLIIKYLLSVNFIFMAASSMKLKSAYY